MYFILYFTIVKCIRLLQTIHPIPDDQWFVVDVLPLHRQGSHPGKQRTDVRLIEPDAAIHGVPNLESTSSLGHRIWARAYKCDAEVERLIQLDIRPPPEQPIHWCKYPTEFKTNTRSTPENQYFKKPMSGDYNSRTHIRLMSGQPISQIRIRICIKLWGSIDSSCKAA